MKYGTKQRLAALVLTALLAFGTAQAQEPVSERDDFYLAVNGPRTGRLLLSRQRVDTGGKKD